jgi:hypothetical protein
MKIIILLINNETNIQKFKFKFNNDFLFIRNEKGKDIFTITIEITIVKILGAVLSLKFILLFANNGPS